MTVRNPFTPCSKDLAALFLISAFAIFFAGDMVWDGKIPFFRDLNNYFYPLRYSLAQAFQAGELPLWNRHMAMGFPLLADIQLGAFYPPHLFFYVLSFFDAVRAIFISHYLIAVTGAYLLCRHWGYPCYQSMIGALLFTLGGTMVSLINLLNHFQSAVWLPWAVLVWERLLLRASWGRFVIFVLVLLCQLLGGSPEIFLMSAGLLWLQGVHLSRGVAKMVWPTCWLLAANLLVMLLAMAQLLPTFELIAASRRQESIPYIEAAMWSLNPWTLLNLVFLDKKVDMGLADATQMFFGLDIPFLVSYYFSAIAVPAIGLWLYYGKTKEKGILVGLILLSLVLAFGRFTPVYPYLYEHIGLFRSFRFPEKLFFLTQGFLLVAMLAGLSAFLAADRIRSRAGLFITGGYFGALVCVYAVLRFRPAVLWNFIIQQKGVDLPGRFILENTASALVSLERQLALAGILLALFFFSKAGYLRAALFQTLLVAIVFLDLHSAHQGFQYLVEPEPVLNSSRVLAAPDGAPNRMFYYPQGGNLHPSTFMIAKPPTTPFREIASSVAGNMLPNFGLFHGFDYMQDINALAKQSYIEFLRYANPMEAEQRIKLLGALNVRHVVSFKALNIDGLKLVQHFPQHPSWLYEVARFIPRAYVAQNTRPETTPQEMIEQLATPEFNPAAEVFLDNPLPRYDTKDFAATASIVKYGNLAVTLRAASNGHGVLVLADSYFPGWRVFVDGKEEKVLRANYFFRGVGISSGEHLVEFKYDPMAFKIGLVVSLTTASILCLVTLTLLVKTRRRISAFRTRSVLAPVGVP